MKTNTNTNNTNTNDALRAVMIRAWDIRRAAALACGVKPSAVLMGACLRMAWEEADAAQGAPRASRYVESIRKEWNAMTPEEQQHLVNACVCKDARYVIGVSVEDKYNAFLEVPAFCWSGAVSLEDVQQQAFCDVLEALTPARLEKMRARRAREGRYEKNLFGVVYGAVHYAVTTVYREQARHARASVRDYLDEDGARRSYIEDFCPSADDTAAEAVYSYAVEEWLSRRDAFDRLIIRGLQAEKTYRQIADKAGKSHVAVLKRIRKMRQDAALAGLCGAQAQAEAAQA